MNDALKDAARFIRDLLTYDEQLIRIGRENYSITDFDQAFIGVDTLAPASLQATSRKFDGGAEQEKIVQLWSIPLVVWFYGVGAWGRASQFSVLAQSQRGHELQESLGISMYLQNQMTDIKLQTGEQYSERVELQANMHYNISTDVPTLRIDTANIEMRNENGIFYQQ